MEIYRIEVNRTKREKLTALHISLVRFLMAGRLKNNFPKYLGMVHSDGEWLTTTTGWKLHRIKIPVENEIPEGVYLPEVAGSSLFLTKQSESIVFPNFKKCLFGKELTLIPYSIKYSSEAITALTIAYIAKFGIEKFKANPLSFNPRGLDPIFKLGSSWELSFDGESMNSAGAYFRKKDAFAVVMPLHMIEPPLQRI